MTTITYPTRAQIVDVTGGPEISPGIVRRTPEESRPHIGKQGLAEEMPDGSVRITLDDGSIIWGSECWWIPINDHAARLMRLARAVAIDVGFAPGTDNRYRDALRLYVEERGVVAVEGVERLLPQQSAEVRAATLIYLGDVDSPETLDTRLALFVHYLKDDAPEVRDAAGLALADLDDVRAVPHLLAAIDKERFATLRNFYGLAVEYLQRDRNDPPVTQMVQRSSIKHHEVWARLAGTASDLKAWERLSDEALTNFDQSIADEEGKPMSVELPDGDGRAKVIVGKFHVAPDFLRIIERLDALEDALRQLRSKLDSPAYDNLEMALASVEHLLDAAPLAAIRECAGAFTQWYDQWRIGVDPQSAQKVYEWLAMLDPGDGEGE